MKKELVNWKRSEQIRNEMRLRSIDNKVKRAIIFLIGFLEWENAGVPYFKKI